MRILEVNDDLGGVLAHFLALGLRWILSEVELPVISLHITHFLELVLSIVAGEAVGVLLA